MRSTLVLTLFVAFAYVGFVPTTAPTTAQVATTKALQFGTNIRLTGPFDQNETAIAVSPKSPRNLVAVFQGLLAAGDSFQSCGFGFTTDGGKSWTSGGKTPLERAGDVCGDPSVAADAQGNFYVSYVEIAPSSPVIEPDVVVAKSTDGGKTFATISVAVNNVVGDPNTPFPDKEFLAVDSGASSPFQGTIYVGYTNISDAGDQIEVVVSRDSGTTWSIPAIIGAPAPRERFGEIGRLGALPVVAPDGTAYIFYAEFPRGSGPLSIRFSKSTDGGFTWSQHAEVASGLPSPGLFQLKNADPLFDKPQGTGLFANSLPTAAAAPDGTVSVAWVDFPQGSCKNAPCCVTRPPCSNSDVRLSVSRDAGRSWTAPVKVTDETNASDQFLPWIAVHPGGLLSLVWQDRRLDPSNINYDTFYTNTADGATFLPNVRVTSTTSLLGTRTFIGDYNGLAVTSDGIFPAWTDTRSGDEDIFTAVGTLPR